ncbi:MAG: LeuD/DmdB family oxidoreductase small subunit [Candidatus Heimdallarchaeota archaeon]
MTKPVELKGRAVVLRDKNDETIDDIDTDMIFHNRYLHIINIDEMGQYALDNLDGWTDFHKTTQKNDILILGANFGSGSSRQQAVDCFTALGVQALIAKSYGAIYKRNAINAGMPILMADIIDDPKIIETGDEITVNLKTGEIKNLTKKKDYKAKGMSTVQLDIYQAGSLFTYAKNL